jgi:hypothetical protein
MQHLRSHLPSLPLPYPCVLIIRFTCIDNFRFIFPTGRRPYIPTVMRATVSPHDATAKNGATEDSRFYKLLHMGLKIISFPFITTGELKWATGIMSVNDDFETCASTTISCLHTLRAFMLSSQATTRTHAYRARFHTLLQKWSPILTMASTCVRFLRSKLRG